MKPQIIILVVLGLVIAGWALWLVSGRSLSIGEVAPPVTAVITDGVQFIDIAAKGGYSPRVIVAKAGVQSVIRVATNGTFDCSSSVVIPALGYQKFLSPTGTEDIVLSPEQAHGTLQGTCTMGMYSFRVEF
ncbi:hypothetical protein COU19_03255 [Candidatus Kaiserbacteria bacterium CG10_big_fil_rev_8_21_14_0_10_56_12]|uniref:EfeO-type cupredoxin-like domain-containing protein n=1 Tax=Candidatus Kaiserbacteria bacterium CG10_big_fil_rev_8_21_14_0_10_56_12 TaxID=1974611 RepID=A0A2H0U954_9BACT|nr:MAG: hypothetical protein COU19_03255 [Candidatus Kaiserbacteria bacterium CG10_big_fil_rev_8_21_14_0_10_56_12]